MFAFPPELLNATGAVRFFSHADAEFPRRVTLGWSREALPSYSWRGLERLDSPCIFQYTLAGRGVLERGGTRYLLAPGTAFLVEVPDDHHYYLPEGWRGCYSQPDYTRRLSAGRLYLSGRALCRSRLPSLGRVV